jgi:hypothetical protein
MLLKGNKCNYVHYWKNNNILIILFEQIFNKIWIFNVYVYVIFEMKYLINKM